jgi:tripartite-type tricarboxylate transporter receptor subunit TctC
MAIALHTPPALRKSPSATVLVDHELLERNRQVHKRANGRDSGLSIAQKDGHACCSANQQRGLFSPNNQGDTMTPAIRTSHRRHVLAAAALGVLAAAPFATIAQEAAFPSKPMRIVVPFPPGGYSDVLARVIAKGLSTSFGQPVVVDNRPGAGGNIGADVIAKSPADGYNLLMGTIGTQSVNPLIYSKMPYNAAKDFAPVAFVADAETVLVVHPSVTARSTADLIALAKKKPGEITFASGGPGTTGQLAGELLKAHAQLDITHIPYKGNVPALNDLVAGQVAMSFATMAPALPFIKDGRLIPLATVSAKRAPALPNVPTMAEQGFKSFEVRNWTGLLAPAGTPPAVTQKIAVEVDKILQSTEAQRIFEVQGLSYTRMGPEAFDRFIQGESAKWGALVQKVGIKAD